MWFSLRLLDRLVLRAFVLDHFQELQLSGFASRVLHVLRPSEQKKGRLIIATIPSMRSTRKQTAYRPVSWVFLAYLYEFSFKGTSHQTVDGLEF